MIDAYFCQLVHTVKKLLFFSWQIGLCTVGCLCASISTVNAQVTSDGTVETQVEQDGNVAEITGGETRGDNLFHSFQDFSVPIGNEAFFDNASNILNIFSRVTGGNISNIDGLIRANGSANLFLINPAGIIFSEGARLDIGGSFYSSSASSILFEDGEFSAVDLENPPLLTINAPIGLSFRDNPGNIENRSVANDDNGLEVLPENSLAFVGGDINFDGGIATGGNIELGGLSRAGIVAIAANGELTFPENAVKSNINFVNSANAEVRGSEGNIILNAENITLDGESAIANVVVPGDSSNSGKITITTRNLNLIDGSSVFASTEGIGNAASVDIFASETITVDGQAGEGAISSIISTVRPGATGNAGSINISANNINFINGGSIFANTTGQGNAGSVNIFANDTIAFDGETSAMADLGGLPTGIVSVVLAQGEGNAGDLNITANNISFTNGARVDASTEGIGNAGLINISAGDTVLFDGQTLEGVASSAISKVRPGAEGNGGNISISADNIIFTNGGRVATDTRGIGNAGSVSVSADNTITFDGIGEINSNPSGIISEVEQRGTGEGGNINITASDFNLINQAQINASTQGQGNAGDISITVNSLQLDRGEILAENSFIEGGEITLDIEDNLTLRNNSTITARAFEDSNGGNIQIDANFIIAFPSQPPGDGNDIIADADRGNGGNINIAANSLFGIAQRPLNPNTNDINASSRVTGLDGIVNINILNLNPFQEVAELSQNVVEPEATTQQACEAQRQIAGSGLTIEGKGGIPSEPGLPLDSHNLLFNDTSQTIVPEPIKTSQGKIQPARGVIVNPNGSIILTAYPTNNLNNQPPENKLNCDRL